MGSLKLSVNNCCYKIGSVIILCFFPKQAKLYRSWWFGLRTQLARLHYFIRVGVSSCCFPLSPAVGNGCCAASCPPVKVLNSVFTHFRYLSITHSSGKAVRIDYYYGTSTCSALSWNVICNVSPFAVSMLTMIFISFGIDVDSFWNFLVIAFVLFLRPIVEWCFIAQYVVWGTNTCP